MVLLRYFPINISPFRWLRYPLKTPGTTHQHIATRSTVLIISGTFHHNKSYGRNLRGQLQQGYRGHGHL